MTNAISVAIWIAIFVVWGKARKIRKGKLEKILDDMMLTLSVLKIGIGVSWFFSGNENFVVDFRNLLMDGLLLLLAIINYFLAKATSE